MAKPEIDVAELRRVAELLATPIDFESLIADGVLLRHGLWYEIIDWDRLPEHARRKIKAYKWAGKGKARVQFLKHSAKNLRNIDKFLNS